MLGEDSMGFNLLYVTQLSKDDVIRGGADFMQNCTMSGAHQMDLHMENDWSDPLRPPGRRGPRRAPGAEGPHDARLSRASTSTTSRG